MTDDDQPTADEASPPLLRIVKGDPMPEEVAALVTVVSALAAAAADSGEKQPPAQWSARHRLLRGPHRHGPGAWAGSAR